MDPISEKVDAVGWAQYGPERDRAIFAWMQEATNRIQQLQAELDALNNPDSQ